MQLNAAQFDSVTLNPDSFAIVFVCSDPEVKNCKHGSEAMKTVDRKFAGTEVVVAETFDQAIVERYGLLRDTAVALFFSKGSEKNAVLVAEYKDNREEFIEFIIEHARDSGAVLDVIEDNAFAFKTFAQLQVKDQIAFLRKLEETYHGDVRLEVYKHLMQKIMKQGLPFIETEAGRLDRLLDDPNISDKSRNQLGLRRNILGQFLIKELASDVEIQEQSQHK
mmetsp:Transcript_35915/g.57347  ORF Transcript_35915/g.57347 Transcript_35915/m.57347 type:complete len:222 (+) Transcript_35915:719-1384(+)